MLAIIGGVKDWQNPKLCEFDLDSDRFGSAVTIARLALNSSIASFNVPIFQGAGAHALP